MATALFMTVTASAQTIDGETDSPWYIQFGLGYHWPGTVQSRSTLSAPDGSPYDWRWQTDAGWAMTGSFGYRFTPHIRLELESGYYNSALASVHAPGGFVNGVSTERPGEPFGLCAVNSAPPKCSHPGGWTFMWSGFLNAIYDIMPEEDFEPFVGAGIGLAHVQWAAHSRTDVFSNVPGTISPANPAVQDFKNAGTLFQPSQLAVQFLGGVSYRLAEDVHLDLTYYHYMSVNALRWNPENTTPGLPPGGGLQTGDFLGHFHDDSTIVSVRYDF